MAVSFDPLLYVSGELKSRKMELAEELMRGSRVSGLYVIYKSETSGRPEMMKSEMLQKRYYRDRDMYICGITDSYETALAYLAVYAYENLVPGAE